MNHTPPVGEADGVGQGAQQLQDLPVTDDEGDGGDEEGPRQPQHGHQRPHAVPHAGTHKLQH